MNIVITGANRGLGLEFVVQCAAAGDRVFAAARKRSAALDAVVVAHDNVTIVDLDVKDDAAVRAAAAAVASHVGAVDVVVNNAAINNKGASFGTFTSAFMLEHFAINAVAPLIVAQEFRALLHKSPRGRVVNVSTQVGSFAWNQRGSSTLYAASKAALNMYTRSIAAADEKIITVAVHPAWVRTDMGGVAAPLSPTESVQHLRRLIDRLAPNDSGQFFNYDGNHHPW